MTTIALTDWPWQWSLDPCDREDVSKGALAEVEGEVEEHENRFHTSESSDQTDKLVKYVLPEDIFIHLIDRQRRLRRCLLLAALACILRPTNILIWICISSFSLFRVVTYGKMVPLTFFGTPIWIHITSLSLSPATTAERYSLIRETVCCGYV